MNAEQMRKKLQELKNEAQSFLDVNNVSEAESKTLEIKILSAQIEIQDKLDLVEAELENSKNDVVVKGEEINSLTLELTNLKNEKAEIMEKYNSATETVAELNSKVSMMQPIVDEYNEKQRTEKLENAMNDYRIKFEKIGGSEIFEAEETQNLVAETISEDKEVSNSAKYSLSEKIMEIIDKQEANNLTNFIQEPTKKTGKLNIEDNEFEKLYGFKKE